ncbi:universal stress protein [Dactylosporangium sp. NPDC051541]|uniref:universal stress protein n=1 Tax=Dactylosporangium sp. NPDC051541 TaxID=3363977 RepID=UPI00379C4648
MNGIGDVIVGIDGTAASDAAVHWAVAEAARMGRPVRLVHAESDPVDTLVRLAAQAALVVVGSHGRNALTEAVYSATGTRVAMRAPGLVAVVRGRVDAADGPVVVGVSGLRHDDRLLDTAFAAAARRGCELVAIHVLPPQAAPWGIGIPPLAPNPVQARANLLSDLTDDVQRWHDKYPTVPAMARVPGGDPASVLLDASAEAQLLVLGGRAHGPAAGLLADSVGHRLLYHAACPLLIQHPHQGLKVATSASTLRLA